MSALLHRSVSESTDSDRAPLRLFAKRPTSVATVCDAHLPLHVQIPAINFLSWKVADELITAGATSGDERIWFEATAIYRDEVAAMKQYHLRDASKDVHTEAKLFGSDIELLLKSRFATDTGMSRSQFEAAHDSACLYVNLFSTVETRSIERRRVISWPASFNVAEKKLTESLALEHSRVVFSKASEVRDRGVTNFYAASLDFTKFYQQFELTVKRFWAFVYRRRVYTLNSIPTGAVLPPLFAQALSRTLLALAVRSANVEAHVRHDCCIDNLRLCSDNLHALWAAWHELIALCSHLGATIGESNPPPMTAPTPYTYLGMLFSIIDDVPQVELSSRSKTKMMKAASIVSSTTPVTVVDAIALFGQTVWATIVTGTPLGELYHVIKFIRRIQRRKMNDLVSIWPSIRKRWSEALVKMTSLRFKSGFRKPNAHVTMFTDASLSGWGVVIFNYGDCPIRIFAGKWSETEKRESINVLELRALRIGVRILASIKSPDEVLSVQIFIDNTSAMSWVKRKRAARYSTNQLALEVDDIMKQHLIQLSSICYIESARNFADKPSRRFETNPPGQLPSRTDGLRWEERGEKLSPCVSSFALNEL